RNRSFRDASSCGVGRTGVVVLPDGSVLPCTDTPLPLGNVRDKGFREIVGSDEASFFRALTWAQVHGCRHCGLVSACGRCHAPALHEGGDSLGPYPTACRMASARYGASAGKLELLPPAPGCGVERDPRMGPFKIEGEGRLRPVPDVRTDDDE